MAALIRNDGSEVTKKPKAKSKSKGSAYKDMPPAEKARQTLDIAPKSESTRPGWKQAPDGNYWSADFEDEYWNSPAGVQEAIGVWGRPIGNRIGNPINWEGWN